MRVIFEQIQKLILVFMKDLEPIQFPLQLIGTRSIFVSRGEKRIDTLFILAAETRCTFLRLRILALS